MDLEQLREQAEADVAEAERAVAEARAQLAEAQRTRAALPSLPRVYDADLAAAAAPVPAEKPVLARIAELEGLISEAQGLYNAELERIDASQGHLVVVDLADDAGFTQVRDLLRSLNGERRGLQRQLQNGRLGRVYEVSTSRHRRTLAERDIVRIAPAGKSPGLFRELRRRVDQAMSTAAMA